jgi:hypothetical protein
MFPAKKSLAVTKRVAEHDVPHVDAALFPYTSTTFVQSFPSPRS